MPYKDSPKTPESSIVVYLSAQHIQNQPLEAMIKLFSNQPKVKFHVYVPKECGKLPESTNNVSIHTHGTSNFISHFAACHGIISTAGHTLLSEAMFLNKPVYALPLKLYEQQINAQTIAKHGFGMMSENLTETSLEHFISHLSHYEQTILNDREFLNKKNDSDELLYEIESVLRQ